MPRLFAVGISGIQAGEDVNKRRFASENARNGDADERM